MQSVGEDNASKPVFLGKESKDFEFSHINQNVQFFECSAKDNQLNNLSDWIDRMLWNKWKITQFLILSYKKKIYNICQRHRLQMLAILSEHMH